ncbi:metallophosphoesterase [Rivularia sp. UHCC 0363]|uniref:metallophosphoesterase n=1 Tax=Rivularia sp. UHCC 0363 TaxID=3110244 RepID=UPI002B21FBBF|nr:metallophosphoesterase [Rivularia sp. UHCC 0363]MEA5595180.1 metallophosphoesterase [Rivularia sp. UHCC 0363]
MKITNFLKYSVLGLFGIFGFLIIWGLIEPKFFDIEEETAVIPNLPPAWEGKRIGQLADFQVGMWFDNTGTMRRSIEKLVEKRPAAVLISGDFIYHSLPNASEELSKVTNAIQPLITANIPTYAVLGNHDYSHKPPKPELGKQVKAALEKIGVTVLQNQAVKINSPVVEANNQPLYLVGIGSYIANNSNVKKALTQLPENSPRMVMMHNPASFEAFPPQTAPLAVAGHTHGGQIRLPFAPQWSWVSLVKGEEVYGDGWIKNYGKQGNHLYVNRGIGFSDIPLRINCPPEVTLFTLRSRRT